MRSGESTNYCRGKRWQAFQKGDRERGPTVGGWSAQNVTPKSSHLRTAEKAGSARGERSSKHTRPFGRVINGETQREKSQVMGKRWKPMVAAEKPKEKKELPGGKVLAGAPRAPRGKTKSRCRGGSGGAGFGTVYRAK